jgi:hypothetical protein
VSAGAHAPWRPEWRRRDGWAPYGFRAAIIAIGEAKEVLEGPEPGTEAEQAHALQVMRAIMADPHGLRQARVGAAKLLERYAKRLAAEALARQQAAEYRRLMGEE